MKPDTARARRAHVGPGAPTTARDRRAQRGVAASSRGIRAAAAAAVLPLLASCSSTPASQIVKQPGFTPIGQQKCGVTKSQAEPLIVEWPSPARAKLETLARRGVVAVRYEGCEMEVLSQCRAPGAYRYTGTERKQDRVTMRDADELYANVPLGAAKLEAKLATAGELNVAMTIVGRYDADRTSPRSAELEGPDCARATHVISALTVGAFDFFAGADATVGGGVSAMGVGAGARSSAVRETLSRDGDEPSCRRATRRDAEPPEGCGALVRVEVVSLAGAGARVVPATPVAPVPAPTPVAPKVECPDGSRWDGARCVRTEVVSECPAGSHRSGERCVPDVDTSCADGMHFESGRGCVANVIAKPEPKPEPIPEPKPEPAVTATPGYGSYSPITAAAAEPARSSRVSWWTGPAAGVRDLGLRVNFGYAGAVLPSSLVVTGGGDDKVKSVSVLGPGVVHGASLEVGMVHDFFELGLSFNQGVKKTVTADTVVLASGVSQGNTSMSVYGGAYDLLLGARLPLWYVTVVAGAGIGYGSWTAHVEGDDTVGAQGPRLDVPLWGKLEINPICQLAFAFRGGYHLSFGRDAFHYPALGGLVSVTPTGCR